MAETRSNPTDDVYAKARAVAIKWIDALKDPAAVPSEEAAQLVDVIALAIQHAVASAKGRARKGAYTRRQSTRRQ